MRSLWRVGWCAGPSVRWSTNWAALAGAHRRPGHYQLVPPVGWFYYRHPLSHQPLFNGQMSTDQLVNYVESVIISWFSRAWEPPSIPCEFPSTSIHFWMGKLNVNRSTQLWMTFTLIVTAIITDFWETVGEQPSSPITPSCAFPYLAP